MPDSGHTLRSTMNKGGCLIHWKGESPSGSCRIPDQLLGRQYHVNQNGSGEQQISAWR